MIEEDDFEQALLEAMCRPLSEEERSGPWCCFTGSRAHVMAQGGQVSDSRG